MAIAAWLASLIVVAAVAWLAMLVHAHTLQPSGSIRLRDYCRIAIKVGATSAVSLLNYRGDLYIVAIMLPPAALGLYSVATSAPQALLLPTQVAALVTAPHIATLERGPAARLAARCVRNNLLVAVALCAALYVAAPFAVNLFYGPAFLPMVSSLRILLLGVVALACASPISTYYTLKLAKPEVSLILASIAAAICIGGSVILVPSSGIVGAAWASSAGYVVGQILAFWYFARTTKIGLRAMTLPTLGDLRLYGAFIAELWRDALRALPPRLAGKST